MQAVRTFTLPVSLIHCRQPFERYTVSERKQGSVKWFNTEKGYGFILNPEGEDVFVHYRSIQVEGFKNLREGQLVSFLQIKSEKGWQAAEVEVDTSETVANEADFETE